MMIRFSGAVIAALLAAAAPASAETLNRASTPVLVLAQASTATDAPARRSRKPKETRSQKEPTAGQMAARERQKKCAAEWKSAKAGGKVEAGMKWPKFWSACNSRLKGNSA